MQYLNTFILSMIGVFAAAIAGGLIVGIKSLMSIKTNVDSMVTNGKKRACENQVQFQMIRAHGEAIKATLEVVSKTQNNGNVTKALDMLEEAKDTYYKYSDGMTSFTEKVGAGNAVH